MSNRKTADAAAAKPEDTKPEDAKPEGTKPEDTKPEDTKPEGPEDAQEVEHGPRLMLDPEGVAHTIVPAGVQALLNLGWTLAD